MLEREFRLLGLDNVSQVMVTIGRGDALMVILLGCEPVSFVPKSLARRYAVAKVIPIITRRPTRTSTSTHQ
jgi:hypothetical protein